MKIKSQGKKTKENNNEESKNENKREKMKIQKYKGEKAIFFDKIQLNNLNPESQ